MNYCTCNSIAELGCDKWFLQLSLNIVGLLMKLGAKNRNEILILYSQVQRFYFEKLALIFNAPGCDLHPIDKWKHE